MTLLFKLEVVIHLYGLNAVRIKQSFQSHSNRFITVPFVDTDMNNLINQINLMTLKIEG